MRQFRQQVEAQKTYHQECIKAIRLLLGEHQGDRDATEMLGGLLRHHQREVAEHDAAIKQMQNHCAHTDYERLYTGRHGREKGEHTYECRNCGRTSTTYDIAPEWIAIGEA